MRGLLFAVLVPVPLLAATLNVPSDYPTIQDGINAAAVGDTVLVAPGTYTDFTTRVQRDACVFLRDEVVLKSSAGSGATVIDMQSAGSSRRANVIYGDQFFGQSMVVEGFTLAGARIDFPTAYFRGTGSVTFRDCVIESRDAGTAVAGIESRDVTVRLEGCRFADLVTSIAASAFSVSGADVTIESCQFQRCIGTSVRIVGGSSGPVPYRAEILNSLFSDNMDLDDHGGAVYASNMDNGILISQCRFEGNRAKNGGALFVGGAEISNSVFVGNRVTRSGGAVYGIDGPTSIADCRFERNRAQNGGGLYHAQGTWDVRNNVFWSNVCEGVSSFGAAIDGGRQGAVVGNTFVGNISESIYSGGALIHFRSGINFTVKTDFSNNVLADTQASVPAVERSEFGEVIDACNIYWNNAGGDASGFTLGTSSRVVDPLFCTGAGEFAVSTASPALPSGSGGCGLIGAFAAGCGPVSVESVSWGQVKAGYRGAVGAGREPGGP